MEEGGFLVGWFKVVGFKVLFGGVSLLHDYFSKSLKFCWSFLH